MQQKPFELFDAAGTQHHPVLTARIASLVPSITELLFDLGLGPQLVARTHYCIHPAGRVEAIPSVGGTKKIRLQRLRQLRPSHVIVNVDENPRELADAVAADGTTVIVTHPLAPADNLDLYRLLGALFDRQKEAETLCQRFNAALTQLTARRWPQRQVLYWIWREPWMTVARSTYISRVLALVNWHSYPAVDEPRYPLLDPEPQRLKSLDKILFSSEPFRFEQRHLDQFASRYGLASGRLQLIDGEMISWYGSRAIIGLNYLARYAAAG